MNGDAVPDVDTVPDVLGPPHFTYLSDVYFDELDLNGVLHNVRFLLHVERATTGLFESAGGRWERLDRRHPDLRYAVRRAEIDYLVPVQTPGRMRVDLWLGHVGRTSAAYHFRCADPAGETTYATGLRVLVKVDEAGHAAPWEPWFRNFASFLHAGGEVPPDGVAAVARIPSDES